MKKKEKQKKGKGHEKDEKKERRRTLKKTERKNVKRRTKKKKEEIWIFFILLWPFVCEDSLFKGFQEELPCAEFKISCSTLLFDDKVSHVCHNVGHDGSRHQFLFKENIGTTKNIRYGLRFDKKDSGVVYALRKC